LCADGVTTYWVRRDQKRSSLFPCCGRFGCGHLVSRSFDPGPSSEFLRFEYRSPSFDGELTYFRARALIAASLSFVHTLRGASQFSRSVPSSGFLDLSTSSSVAQLAGLFRPATTSRTYLLFRGFSLRAAVLSFSSESRVPPCRCFRSAHQSPGGHEFGASASRFFSARSRVPTCSDCCWSVAPLFRFQCSLRFELVRRRGWLPGLVRSWR